MMLKNHHMNKTYIQFQAHGLRGVLETDITLSGITAKLVYPFTSVMLNFKHNTVQNADEKLDCMVNFFSEHLTYYLNIIAYFDDYNREVNPYRNLAELIESGEGFSYEEKRDTLICLGTNLFHELEGKIPVVQIRMSLFFALLNCICVDEFKKRFAPPENLHELISKNGVTYHKSCDSTTFRSELMKFENQMN